MASERNFFGVIFPSDDCCVCLFSCVSQCVCVCKVILLFFSRGPDCTKVFHSCTLLSLYYTR